MEKDYSIIYERLVQDENDIVGLIAYSIYKRHKIEFIKSYKETHDGKAPTPEEFKAFVLSTCAPVSLKQYRDNAETFLQQMTLEAAREEISAFEKQMLDDYKANIQEVLMAQKNQFLEGFGEVVKDKMPKGWQSMLWSMLAGFTLSVLVALFYWIGSSSEKDSIKLVNDVVTTVRGLAVTDSIVADTIR